MLVIQSIPHHSQNRVAGTARQAGSLRHVSGLDGGENFLDPFWIAAHPAAPPPENALEHDGDGNNRYNQDRPHDGTALAEVIDEEICPACFFWRRGRRGRRRWRSRAQSR